MAYTLHNDIDIFRKKTLENSIIRELSNVTNEERKIKLIQLLDELNEKSKIKIDPQEELDEHFILIQKQMNMQPWNKLQLSYKKEKIIEYCNINTINDLLREKIFQLVDENHLTNKYVEYNQLQQKIDNILLIKKNELNEYYLDDDKIKKIITLKSKSKSKSKK
jgi:hypothetical protein